MKIHEEILTATTDTNMALTQLNRNIESLIQSLSKTQEIPPAPQKIGFIQNAVKGVLDNPKTSLAGISSVVLAVSSKFFPQYAEIINSCMVGVSGSGLLLARDSKAIVVPVQPVQSEELLG